MIFGCLGIWFIIAILLNVILGIHDAASLYRAFALAGPYAVLGIAASAVSAKLAERRNIGDSWWAIISAVFYISVIIASISIVSFLTWAALKFISTW